MLQPVSRFLHAIAWLSLAATCAQAAEPVLSELTIGSRKAYLVRPPGVVRQAPAILFVHWYEPESADSNRTQFLSEAMELARDGVISLLPETMWSKPEWFPARNVDQDLTASLNEIQELKLALDVLLAEKGVDPGRVAYVGHDFGMMYGVSLGKSERRVQAWALQAGTAEYADWFLYGRQKLPDQQKQQIREQLAPIAPVNCIREMQGDLLLQFGTRDFHVPMARAELLASQAPSPKTVLYYDAGHGLNAAASRDRRQWLRKVLNIKATHQ